MIEITLGNNVSVSGLPADLRRSIIAKFSLPNQAYFIAQKLGKSTYRLPRYIPYVTEDKEGNLILPRGMGAYAEKLLRQTAQAGWTWKNNTFHPAANLISTIQLRDYQVPVVDEVIRKFDTPLDRISSGIVEMGTGTGKTAVALKIAEKLGVQTTVLVPNLTLLNQWAKDVENWFGFEPGRMSGQNRTIGPITIATWQSAGKTPELFMATGLLIIDEVQCVTSPVRRLVLGKFAPAYILGLTATVDRSDGQGMGVKYLVGNTLAKYEKTELKPAVEIVRSEVEIGIVKDARGAMDYAKTVDAMIQSKSRNTLIAGLLIGELLLGRKVLVLTKRIAHYHELRTLLPASFEGIHTIDSDDEERHALLEGFKSGFLGFNAILGTTSLLAVGTDIPALDTIILACDIRSDVLTTQSVGRILRVFEGKPQPKIIDIWDGAKYEDGEMIVFNPVFHAQFRARRNLYIKKGWLQPFKKATTNANYGDKKAKYYAAKERAGG